MNIACSTSAYKCSLDEALASVARMGFSHVDLIAIPGWGQLEPSALAENWQAGAERVGTLLAQHRLTPVAVNLAVGNPHQRDAAIVAQRLRDVEGAARFMQQLGITVASFYPGYRVEDRPWDDVLADTVTSIREMLAVAGEYGVTLAVELHMFTPFETVAQGSRLLEAVPELTVAYDPSHYAMQSIDLHETKPFIARAVHVHLRDAAPEQMAVAVGTGTVDFTWILDTLRARDYQGNISIEYLPDLPDVEGEIMRLRELLGTQA